MFLNRTINDLVLLLRDPQSQPVAAAEKIIRGFCTKELRGVEGGVGDVEEYVANAMLDLVIMGIWALGAGQVGLERLPVSQKMAIWRSRILSKLWIYSTRKHDADSRRTRSHEIPEPGQSSVKPWPKTRESSAKSLVG